MSKRQRQHVISGLLESHSVSNQAQLVELLGGEDIDATQTTVSRDLDELGAIKVRVPGGDSVYAIPEHSADRVAPEEHLRKTLNDWVAAVGSSGNIALLHTPPGSAHVVATALDRAGMPEVLGTVAGDDTLIIVAAEPLTGADLAAKLRGLAGL